METLGSLIDKFSISKLRLNKMIESKIEDEKINLVKNQSEKLKLEIDSFLFHAVRKEIELEEPKYKFYRGENPSGENFDNLSGSIDRLFEANYILWNLEDKRREKDLQDNEIRKICDDVAKFNRVRNDMIDEINHILTKKIKE